MDFKMFLSFAFLMKLLMILSYATESSDASRYKPCLVTGYSDEREQDENSAILNNNNDDNNHDDNNDDPIKNDAEDDERVADPHYGYGRRYTLKIQVLQSCGNKLCNSYRAKILVYSRLGRKVCGHGRRRSSRYITIHCRLNFRPVTVSVYWPSYRKRLIIRRLRTTYTLRAIRPRSRRQTIQYSSLQFCGPQSTPASHTVTITDANQGTTCPTGRIRFPVGSTQDLKARTLDGRLNNKKKLFQGARGENLIRLAGNGFVDKISVPSGACTATQRGQSKCPFPKENNGTGSNRPNARVISNYLIAQNRPIPSRRGLSDLITYFGQVRC